MFKVVVLATLLAVAHAGFLAAPAPAALGYTVSAPAIGASHQSTLRSLDGNAAVSHYSKAVDSAFSSVRKVDTRISNDAIAYAPGFHAAVPAYAATPVVHAAPLAAPLAAPVVAKTAVAAPIGVAYSAAPAVAHLTFDGLGVHYAW